MLRLVKVIICDYESDNSVKYFENASRFDVKCEYENYKVKAQYLLLLEGNFENISNFMMYLMMKELKVKDISR